MEMALPWCRMKRRLTEVFPNPPYEFSGIALQTISFVMQQDSLPGGGSGMCLPLTRAGRQLSFSLDLTGLKKHCDHVGSKADLAGPARIS